MRNEAAIHPVWHARSMPKQFQADTSNYLPVRRLASQHALQGAQAIASP